mgnify:CR=1 FL=1|tara:strand:- start:1055 stop:1912 length:858 start_codon:yes stop_codon:yes gene_type:complete
MNTKIKHSKIKNTGILFELLTRQITVDVLNDNDGDAVIMLKKFFSPSTQLGKEYELYKILNTEKYSNDSKANHLIEAVVKTYKKINKKQLKNEKYNLVKEIKNNYDVNDFFRARIPNYKVHASIYKLFESIHISDPKIETESRFTIIENIISKSSNKKRKGTNVIESYKKQEKDLRLLTYTVLVEKFNKKYKTLSENQRSLLKKYIYNISNTNSLKEFIEKESIEIKKELQSFLPEIDDKVTKIKLKEAINQIKNLLKGKIVEDNQVVSLMRYYQLVKELKDVVR